MMDGEKPPTDIQADNAARCYGWGAPEIPTSSIPLMRLGQDLVEAAAACIAGALRIDRGLALVRISRYG